MDNNFITQTDHEKHTIKKYEFRSIDKALEESLFPLEHENVHFAEDLSQVEEEKNIIFQENLNEILQGNKNIENIIKSLQNQIQELSSNTSQTLIDEAKKSSYEQGLIEGERKTREALEAQIETQREALVLSIQNLEKTLLQSCEKIKVLENELSAIAVDLAREVIIKEIQEDSAKIAYEIAHELLLPIADDNEITLRANPQDLPYLQEKLSQIQKIHFEADTLISRGGVIISSLKGNFDGTILSRYKNLKRAILEEKGL